MKKVHLFIVVFTFFSGISFSQQKSAKLIPQRILLNLTETPSNSIAINWRTLEKVNLPEVKVAEASDWTDFDTMVKVTPAFSEKFIIENNAEVYQHSAVLYDLKPNTIYAYRVGGDSIWSEWNQFTTADAENHHFTFTYIGDIQHDVKNMGSRLIRKAYSTSPESDFWIYTGDVVDKAEHDYLWDEFFEACGFITSIVPTVFVAGNHEYIDTIIDGQETDILAELWKVQITQPKGEIAGLDETVFYFDYQGVRFIVLNGNEKLEEQAIWLEKVLSENKNKWIIVAIHQPIYSMSKGRDQKNTRNAFLPAFDKYNVDLVIQGHDHVYARTGKMKNNALVESEKQGTVYITSNAGSDEYTPRSINTPFALKIGNKVQLFQVLTIDGSTLDYKAYSVTGKLYDSFKLIK